MRHWVDWDEHKELCEAARKRYREGYIDEIEFRRLLGNLGFTATAIDAEVQENEPL